MTDKYISLQVDATQSPPQLVPRLVSLAQILAQIVGTAAGDVAAGDDPRLVNAAQLDEEDNLAVPGQAFTLGGGKMSMAIDGDGNLTLTASALIVKIPLPTTDPGNAGQWWNNGQYVGISAGASS